MIDIEKILAAGDDEALKELKTFLFKENIRLENERREMEEYKEKLIKERAQFQKEMDLLNHKMVMEQKRLKDEHLFFDKKLQILQDGFRQLDLDKRRFEKEKARFALERELWEGENGMAASMEEVAAILFRGANNPLTLRKRYKDLLKIFHPDNLCGDAELVQMINRVYEKRKRAE